MHPNPIYRKPGSARNIAFARERSFGVLCINGPEGPLISHVPFVLAEDGKTLDLHLVRSNPILRLLETPQKAVIAINGPDSYISPDWYGIDDQVPTWNYVAVHMRGTLEQLPAAALRDVLDQLSAQFEHRLSPKPVWAASKMTPEALAKMMRVIVPFRMHISTIDGTWKLNQNKAADVRLRAADAVGQDGIGTGLSELADLMRTPPETKD